MIDLPLGPQHGNGLDLARLHGFCWVVASLVCGMSGKFIRNRVFSEPTKKE